MVVELKWPGLTGCETDKTGWLMDKGLEKGIRRGACSGTRLWKSLKALKKRENLN
jgi:hypothetical protein